MNSTTLEVNQLFNCNIICLLQVQGFELLPAAECLERVFSPEFKTTSCPVIIDFLIRHGFITPENGKNNFPF